MLHADEQSWRVSWLWFGLVSNSPVLCSHRVAVFLFGFAGSVGAAFGSGGAFEVSWVVGRVGLVTSCKHKGSFVSLCFLGAGRDQSHRVCLWNRYGAGEQRALACVRWWMLCESSVVTDMMLTDGIGGGLQLVEWNLVTAG